MSTAKIYPESYSNNLKTEEFLSTISFKNKIHY